MSSFAPGGHQPNNARVKRHGSALPKSPDIRAETWRGRRSQPAGPATLVRERIPTVFNWGNLDKLFAQCKAFGVVGPSRVAPPNRVQRLSLGHPRASHKFHAAPLDVSFLLGREGRFQVISLASGFLGDLPACPGMRQTSQPLLKLYKLHMVPLRRQWDDALPGLRNSVAS